MEEVEPDEVPEKDDADQGESHPPLVVEKAEPVEVLGKEHEDVVEGKSHPGPAVDEKKSMMLRYCL
ncbi:hypothetical protein CASFOL_029085 [Castilleja foliolosa]|uniref:Uncharacterized protein n=1 Tax=Castilleja foliolosa TaxID=1961234 RepID=A0ABD3CGB1_9LAMI